MMIRLLRHPLHCHQCQIHHHHQIKLLPLWLLWVWYRHLRRRPKIRTVVAFLPLSHLLRYRSQLHHHHHQNQLHHHLVHLVRLRLNRPAIHLTMIHSTPHHHLCRHLHTLLTRIWWQQPIRLTMILRFISRLQRYRRHSTKRIPLHRLQNQRRAARKV